MPSLLDIVFTGRLSAIECAACGIMFGVPEDMVRRRREDHKSFFCPNGHSSYFPQDNEAERLKKQLERTEACLASAREDARIQRANRQAAQRQTAAQKGVVTRMKRRIQHGRCVCCSRQFKDLERHMQSQHPSWSPEKHAEALAAK